MEAKIKVLSLFDDGMGSVINSLDKEKYDVVSVGIKNATINLDLSNSLSLSLLIEKIGNWIPNIIVSSPPCESWSIAANYLRTLDKDLRFRPTTYYDEFKKTHPKYPNNVDFYAKMFKCLNGIGCIVNTCRIIKHFKPKYWYIENPSSSQIWDFIEKLELIKGIPNHTYYHYWDKSFSKKPTNFLSSNYLWINPQSTHKALVNLQTKISGYDNRSKIPSKLIQKIFDNFI